MCFHDNHNVTPRPIIGNIIWYVRIQDAINTYWTAHGQTNEPGL